MQAHQFRRPERMITDPQEFLPIIRSQKYMHLALCKDNQPYLVTVNYAFDANENRFYFHCASKGKKIEYLQSNPFVWGEIVEDLGYLPNECNHAYRSVQFLGRTEFLDGADDKKHALDLLIDQLEPNPEQTKRKMVTEKAVRNVAVVRVRVEYMSSKRNPVKE
jgi:nitroimidazol reductase NimA-like FMN-containing flavoprotein (pyridoxamine 5'-phosphate oxidase superfamily)